MMVEIKKGDRATSLAEALVGALQSIDGAGARAVFAAQWLCCAGIGYSRERIEDHRLLGHCVDFSSFDCATFVYAVNALVNARSLDAFVETLHDVRYSGPPSVETLIHYSLNVLRRFEARGVLYEVRLTEPSHLRERCVLVDDRGGRNWFIQQEKIGDQNRGRSLCFSYTPTALWTREMAGVCDGDTIVFVSAKPPHEYPGIVGHLGIAYRTPAGELTMYHCTKMTVGAKDGPCAGVSMLRHWDEAAQALCATHDPRTVMEYLCSNPELFCGAAVFRPIDGPASFQ